jgi:hypothetical protein
MTWSQQDCCQAGHIGPLQNEQGTGDKTFRSYFRQRFKGVAAQLLHRGTTNGGDGDDYR